MFRQTSFVLLILFLLTGASWAERPVMPFADYRSDSWFLPQSPSVTSGPAASLFNPAAWAMAGRGAADFWWNDANVRPGLDNYGFSLGRGLGFTMTNNTFGSSADHYRVRDYLLGISHGTRAGTFGLGYRWAGGATERRPREKALSAGFIFRKRSWLSLGAAGTWSLQSPAAQYVFDLGLRPFDRSWLTLFADYTINDDQAFFRDGYWGAGMEVRPLRGVQLGFKARQALADDDVEYSALVGLAFGGLGEAAMPHFNQDGDQLNVAYLIRANPPTAGMDLGTTFRFSRESNNFYPLNLENKFITYQKYRYFDESRVAWLDLLGLLNRLEESTTIQGVVINMAGLKCRSSLLWEFRQKIEALRASGKQVIVHLDRAGSGLYYLASAADHISLDPYGSLSLPGLALSRSYLKGTLEKLGLGFQAHRYFKYKSAVETLSRDHMSEADREQRQRIADVIYDTLGEGVSAGRNLAPGQFDGIVDNLGELVAREAQTNGLVDEISRWDQLTRNLTLAADLLLPSSSQTHDEQWGAHLKIPVVYAVGECAMDTGIKGRSTSAYLRGLIDDPDVAAVVLRADSPGGDPLPSDLVTDAVQQLKEAGKPVIVSQGDVAASGGYWISMEGTRILTTPLTITGSIGVISGWLYDDGLAAKAGITSDTVQRGKHSDLFSTVNFPFLGGIPRRPMTESELQRTETLIRGMYDDFVAAVAKGRHLPVDRVAELAQGRVWMGGDAIERGLCDQFGSLDDAIQLARELSGTDPWRQVDVVEYPPRPLFEMPGFLPRLPSLFGFGDRINRLLTREQKTTTPEPGPILPMGLDPLNLKFLRNLNTAAGQPVLMVSPDLLPQGWRDLK